MVPDGDFHPNILNSIVFILSAWMQLNTFAVNYCGKPFTQVRCYFFPIFQFSILLEFSFKFYSKDSLAKLYVSPKHFSDKINR